MGSTALPALVRAAIATHSISPSLIVLEITERTLVRETEINNDVLAELASLGVGLVLDDFGTGYSMLGYLKRMPITALKIDQSFIEGIPGDADSRAIVHAMLAVARHFKLRSLRKASSRSNRSSTCAASGASSLKDSSTRARFRPTRSSTISLAQALDVSRSAPR